MEDWKLAKRAHLKYHELVGLDAANECDEKRYKAMQEAFELAVRLGRHAERDQLSSKKA